MESSPVKEELASALPSMVPAKRKVPSLLPAFEPFSSSPGFPRASKRQAFSSEEQDGAYRKYPTPMPSSTTGILSSSPTGLRAPINRPSLLRTVSDRAPLATIRSVTLPESGEEVLMGRSSNSSHVQLSSNRLISRVHVKARYLPATESEKHKIELECCGWNGAKVLCNGGINEIRKGDTFVSVLEHAEIILDVHDARIRIQWPETEAAASDSDDTEAAFDPNSPTARKRWIERTLKRSPLPANVPRLFPPASPTPANRSFKSFLTERSDNSILQIYEDHSSPRKAKAPEAKEDELPAPKLNLSQSIDRRGSSQFSALNCEQYDSDADAEHDPDEENDPIVHSFGPFGANLSARMASFSAGMSPIKRREEPKERLAPIEEPIAAPIRFSPPPEEKPVPSPTRDADTELMINHVLNQLAFSRLSSTPISVIMNNLPASLKLVSTPSRTDKRTMTLEDLQKLLIATPSIGEIHREGKDAAGKPLESEYYYIAEADTDVHRKAAVEGLRKPSLRACRKQHKQYYWKKPKTP